MATPHRIEITKPYNQTLGDIVSEYNFPSALIVQINNCTARKSRQNSFTWNISKKYPYGDPYKERTSGRYPNLASVHLRPKLGCIQLRYPPKGEEEKPTIACLFSQYKMGTPSSRYYLDGRKTDREYIQTSRSLDTYFHRKEFFKICLFLLVEKLEHLQDIKIVVFPKKIGCGYAGGNWVDYESIICHFCYKLKSVRPDISVHIMEKV